MSAGVVHEHHILENLVCAGLMNLTSGFVIPRPHIPGQPQEALTSSFCSTSCCLHIVGHTCRLVGNVLLLHIHVRLNRTDAAPLHLMRLCAGWWCWFYYINPGKQLVDVCCTVRCAVLAA